MLINRINLLGISVILLTYFVTDDGNWINSDSMFYKVKNVGLHLVTKYLKLFKEV